jgi:hypothetical protein
VTRPLHAFDDEGLGRVIAGLDLGWPAPREDLVERVVARLDRPAPRRRSTARVLLLVAAIVLLLAGAAVAARVVFDLGAITIEPAPTDRPLPTASTIPDLGEPVSLEEAEAITGTTASSPAALGPPDRVWVDAPEDQPIGAAPTRIVMAWRPTEALPAIPGSPFGAVLIRWDAHVAAGVKLVGGQDFRHVEVAGWPEGFWVRSPHELVVSTSEGPRHLVVRGHVLLWGDETTTFRLESGLGLRDAIALAETTGG